MVNTISRRAFMATSAMSATLAFAAAETVGAKPAGAPQVCVFSKHLHFITDYKTLAKTCRDIKVDGVDLTVRKAGHVEPASVEADLPRAVEAIRAEGLEVPMITTALVKGDDPDARRILAAASKLGIRYFRIGGQKYSDAGNPAAELPKFTAEVKSLVAIAKEFNMAAAYHNHSGANNVGAPVWDLYEMFREVKSDALGVSFDVAHATIEGGLSGWNINARLMAPYAKVMAVKDFKWQDGAAKWCPLGEGQVKTVAALKIMRGGGFSGPISMHFEYKTPSNDAVIEEIRKSASTLRGYVREAGYS